MRLIETERLILRPWTEDDIPIFLSIHQNPSMMQYLAGPRTIEESSAFILKSQRQIQVFGYGRWACEFKKNKALIGFIGLGIPLFDSHFTPAVELGFRIDVSYWGQGLAVEGGKAALNEAFKKHNLNEVVSYANCNNQNAINVMKKLGMNFNKEDVFLHPNLPANHPLAMHVLYRAENSESP